VDALDVRDTISRISGLPTLPAVLGQILEALSDPDSSALDLGKHIAADQSLSATLLRQVNSAYYGFYRRITDVKDAVVILGFREVQNMVMAATAFRTFPRGRSGYDRARLWRHSLASAMAAERVAKRVGLQLEGGYFSAGLLHDIGKVALDSMLPEHFDEAVKLALEQGKPLYEVEPIVFGLDHAEVGGVLGEHWNLPPILVEAIRRHHQPETALLSPELAQVTAVANHLAYLADFGDSVNPESHAMPAQTAIQLKLTPAAWEPIVAELREAEARIEAMLGAIHA
jgi:putative nucleotidyltransferase with HDIG domain